MQALNSLLRSTFFNNTATRGGAIFFSTSPTSASILATIVGSTFDRNSATDGGATYLNNSVSLTVSSTTFKSNSLTGSGGRGAAINAYGCPSLTITDSIVTGSMAANNYGAGVDVNTCPNVLISSTSFTYYTGAVGAGLYLDRAQGRIIKVKINYLQHPR